MTTEPSIGLRTHSLPSLTEEEAKATASPARGNEMKIDIFKKIRVPDLLHIWDFWHEKPTKAGINNTGSHATTLVNFTKETNVTISDARAFFEVFNNSKIQDLGWGGTFHFFLQGIKPKWEDERNSKGGSLNIRNVKIENAEKCWLEIGTLAIGENLQAAVETKRESFNDHICGISISMPHRPPPAASTTRPTAAEMAWRTFPRNDSNGPREQKASKEKGEEEQREKPKGPEYARITIWNRDANNTEGIDKLREMIIDQVSPELLPPESNIFYKKHSHDKNYAAAMAAYKAQ